MKLVGDCRQVAFSTCELWRSFQIHIGECAGFARFPFTHEQQVLISHHLYPLWKYLPKANTEKSTENAKIGCQVIPAFNRDNLTHWQLSLPDNQASQPARPIVLITWIYYSWSNCTFNVHSLILNVHIDRPTTLYIYDRVRVMNICSLQNPYSPLIYNHQDTCFIHNFNILFIFCLEFIFNYLYLLLG